MNIINKELYKMLKDYKSEVILLNRIIREKEKDEKEYKKVYKERYDILNQDLLEAHRKIWLLEDKINKATEHINNFLIPFGNEWHWDNAAIYDEVVKLLDILRGEE